MESLEQIRYCRHCDAIINIKDEICTFCQLDTSYKIPLHLEKLTFKECADLINEAFFKIEMFMNGKQKTYQYFGFNDHFTKLFQLVNEMKNYTHANWDLVNDYFVLANDIQYTHDNGIDIVPSAFDNECFNSDCNELSTLLNYRTHEFSRFDEISDYDYKRTTIVDLLENKPQQPEPLLKNPHETIFAGDFAFTLFEKMKAFYSGESTDLANYSFLFYVMQKDGFVICRNTDFVKLLPTYNITIDKIDPRQIGTNKKATLYKATKVTLQEKHGLSTI